VKKLVSLQLFLYLVLSPAILYLTGERDSYRLDLAVVMIFSFFVGGHFSSRKIIENVKNSFPYCTYYIYPWMNIMMFIFSLLYVYTIFSNGLYERRQGSELMAVIYANMPISHLFIIRIYEVIFYPFVILLLHQSRWSHKSFPKWMILSLISAFFFMGILDSRSKLLMPLVFYLVFFYFQGKSIPAVSPIFFKVTSLFLILGVIFVVLHRLEGFDDFYSYFIVDFLKRLDGLELISLVNDHKTIPFFGTYDFLVFSNFLSSIPFLDSAKALKEIGLTSSKSYLLQSVLDLKQMDMNNTIVTDLFYFGGYPFLAFGGFFYGFYVTKFDVLVRNDRWLCNRLTLAMLISFGINALRIEQDFFGMVLAVFRDFFILNIFLLGLSFKRHQ